jgi:putative ABC transport system permease protein
MSLGLTEIRRSRLRFGLLTAAVALLVFLVLLLSTLGASLVGSLTGALDRLGADGLVYASSARDNIAASRLDPSVVEAVSAVPGVAATGAVGSFTTRAELGGAATEVQVFGFTPGSPGAPTALTDGRLPTAAGEAAVDARGVDVGDAIALADGEGTLQVVGLLRGSQFNALPTIYVPLDTYDAAVSAANPGLPFVPVNAIAFDIDPGADVTAVAAAVTAAVPGTQGYSRSDAVARIPGIDSISQSFGILVGLTFVIGIVVIGFFFLILTVQKLRAFTLLRAIGATTGSLAAAVVLQITVVVAAASVAALALTALALRGLSTGLPVNLSPVTVGTTVIAVWLFSMLAGLLSVRRIARIDPATAVGSR